ncbi:type II toxin-antitoxin system HicB family antitoxin [Mesorhizobium sp. M0136]|uniref:type II toxin-antitoxin system HicB family antitoxin n=1 Tax=Mesorhizobium sp. M0136 TaxID=2956890 RepID=UPI0033390C48
MTVETMVTDILRKPYARMVIPDSDGTFSAEIVEFPGCIASGATASEALANLEEVAADWIDAALNQGQEIPEPMEAAGYSGKLVLRMPKSLHQRAALYAEREGVSLNQFIVTCLAEHVGVRAQSMTLSAQSLQNVYAPIFLGANIAVLNQTLSAFHPQGQTAMTSGPQLIVTPINKRVPVDA